MERYVGSDAHASSCTLGIVGPSGKRRDRAWWLAELPEATRPLSELLYEAHDALVGLKAKAEEALLAEARKHVGLAVRSAAGTPHSR